MRGLELNGYRSVLLRLLYAAACVFVATPGSAAKLNQYYVPRTSPVALKFSALDPSRTPIDERWLLEGLAAALQERSDWPLRSAGEKTAELSGLRTRLDQDRSVIVFEYVHVARNRNGDEWGETLTIPVSYRIQQADDALIVRLRPAQMADLATRGTPGMFFLPTPKLRPVAELFDDFAAIIDRAHTVELRHAFLLNGQEEANSPPEMCIASFDRLLGRYGYAKGEEHVFDLSHDDVFLYRTARESVPLKIAAIHYRGGSKVFYEAWVPFEMRADGTVTGSDLAPALKLEVRRILEAQPARTLDSTLEATHDQGNLR
jgi:hypothetical protein